MITRAEVIANGLISEEVLDEIPETCECGAEVVFTDTLKQIMCSNPRCYHKIASRMENMAKAMQVDGFGASTCLALCKQYKMISPFQAFLLNGSETVNGVSALDKKINGLKNSEAIDCELWQMVSYASIPGVDTIAYKIFNGYNTIEEAYADIEKYQVPMIADKLGQKSGGSGVIAVNIYNTLMEYKTELMFGERFFRIKKQTGDKIQIAITDSVYGYPNKSAYVKELNMTYEGKASIIRLSSVTKEVEYLISDGSTGSNKYKKALKMQESGHPIRIVTSEEFKEILREKYGE